VEDRNFSLVPILEKKSDADGFFNFALSPDGKTLLTIGDEDGTSGPIHIWQLPESVWPRVPDDDGQKLSEDAAKDPEIEATGITNK